MTLPSLIANQLVAADKIRIHSGMGSHELTALLTPTPSTLDTRGNNYTLPDFPPVIADQLKGKKVLIISADGPELPELIVPMIYLAERGAEVVLAGQDWIFQYREPAGHIVVAQWLAPAYCIRADIGLSEV